MYSAPRAVIASRVASRLAQNFDFNHGLSSKHKELQEQLQQKQRQLQQMMMADSAQKTQEVVGEAQQFVNMVGEAAASRVEAPPANKAAFMAADDLPQDTVKIVDGRIWKVGTADSGGKFWVPVYVPTCGFPAAFVQDKRKVLETGYGKDVVEEAAAATPLQRFVVPENMPEMPAVVGTRAGQWLKGAEEEEGEQCAEINAMRQMQVAKFAYYATRGYMDKEAMQRAKDELARAEVSFQIQQKQLQAVQGEQRKLQGEILVAQSYIKDMRQDFEQKQATADVMGMKFAIESLKLARYKGIVLLKQKRRLGSKLKLYQCNYKEARRARELAKQCFAEKMRKHEDTKHEMIARCDLQPEKTEKVLWKEETAKVAQAKKDLEQMELQYEKLKSRERVLKETVERFDRKKQEALAGAGKGLETSQDAVPQPSLAGGDQNIKGGLTGKQLETLRALLKSAEQQKNLEDVALLEALNQRKASEDDAGVKEKLEEMERLIESKRGMDQTLKTAEQGVEEEIGLRARPAGSRLPPNVKEAMDGYLKEQVNYMHDQAEEERRNNARALEEQREEMKRDLRKVKFDMVEQAVGAADDFRNDVDNALVDTGKQIETEEDLVLGIQQQLLNEKKLDSVRKEMDKLAQEIEVMKKSIKAMGARVEELLRIIRETDPDFGKTEEKDPEAEAREKQRIAQEAASAERAKAKVTPFDVAEVTVDPVSPLEARVVENEKLRILTEHGHILHLNNGEIEYALLKYSDTFWYEGYVDNTHLRPAKTGILVVLDGDNITRYRGEWKNDAKVFRGFREKFVKTEAVPTEVMFSESWDVKGPGFPSLFADGEKITYKDPSGAGALTITCDPATDSFGYLRTDGDNGKFVKKCGSEEYTVEESKPDERSMNGVFIRRGKKLGQRLLMYGTTFKTDCGPWAFYSWQWDDKEDGDVFVQVGSDFDEKRSVSGYLGGAFNKVSSWLWKKVGYKQTDNSSVRAFDGLIRTGFHCTMKFKTTRDSTGLYTSNTKAGTFTEMKPGLILNQENNVFVYSGSVWLGVPHGTGAFHFSKKVEDLDNVFVGQCWNGKPHAGYLKQENADSTSKFWGTFLTPVQKGSNCWYVRVNTGRNDEAEDSYVYARRSFSRHKRFDDEDDTGAALSNIRLLCTNRAVKNTLKLKVQEQVTAGIFKEFATPLLNDESGCNITGGSLVGGATFMVEQDHVQRVDADWLDSASRKVNSLVERMSTAPGTDGEKESRELRAKYSDAVLSYVRSFKDAVTRRPRDAPGALRPSARKLADAVRSYFVDDLYKHNMSRIADWLYLEC